MFKSYIAIKTSFLMQRGENETMKRNEMKK